MATELGVVYVTVTASTKGMVKDIEKAYNGHASSAGSAGGKAGSAFGEKFASAAKVGIGALAAGTAAITRGIVAMGKAAVSSFADYEQLTGGMDKLFGDASEAIQEHAREAFMTAGLSMNEYMETVTGFSASMINSLGGDTAAAAEMADQAIRDMSDNANTFGTDMSTLQAAYQGFARGNYTMLDSLSLGFGGTKEGMEQLIAEANRLREANGEAANRKSVV